MPRVTGSVSEAARALREGLLVAFPTETVYGLGAHARHEAAVRRVFAAKGRPADHPLIVHLADGSMVDEWAADVPAPARALAAACWPGPLTLLVPRRADVLDVVTGGRATVGLRVPAHPLAHALLEAVGDGVAAPSANRFGSVSPTTAAHVVDDLGEAVDLVLDGGPCAVGVESTIVDCTVEPVQVLRPGGVSAERIAEVIGTVPAAPTGPSRAPGMLASHYAPRARVVLADDRDQAAATAASLRGHGRVIGAGEPADTYARHLYAWLRAADRDGIEVVVAVLPPDDGGLGTAVRDRLAKAAAPRDHGAH
jgi:L-threonylcarbamoyladenylate synthase